LEWVENKKIAFWFGFSCITFHVFLEGTWAELSGLLWRYSFLLGFGFRDNKYTCLHLLYMITGRIKYAMRLRFIIPVSIFSGNSPQINFLMKVTFQYFKFFNLPRFKMLTDH
jgi:hypothetical protein